MRLIDADKLIAHLKDEIDGCKIPSGSRANGKGIVYGTALGLKSAISFAKTAPKIDIKTKVAKEIFAEIEKVIDKHYNIHIFGSNDLEDEEKDAVINFSDDVTCDLAELKNKYTKEGVGE